VAGRHGSIGVAAGGALQARLFPLVHRQRLGFGGNSKGGQWLQRVVELLTVFCLLIGSAEEKKTERGYSWLLVLPIGGRGKGRGVFSGFACSWGRN
jgi:hypothetical protein